MSEQHNILINGSPWSLSVGLASLSRNRHTISRSRHRNSGYEVTLVLQGSCQLDVGSRHYTLQAGQAVIIAPGIFHTLRSLPGAFDHFTFRMTLPRSNPARSIRNAIPDHRVFSITDKMCQLCFDLFGVYEEKSPYWQDMYSAQLKQLVLMVLRLLNITDETNRSIPYKSVKKRTSQVYEFIDAHLSGSPHIEELAACLQLSTRQTKRVLQECFGHGFREMLLNARMDRAQWLLRTTDKSPALVAGEVGYASEVAFYRAFRGRFQVTPAQYRKQAKDSPTE